MLPGSTGPRRRGSPPPAAPTSSSSASTSPRKLPRATILVDRRPSLGLFGQDSPWLDKPAAILSAAEAIAASAVAALGEVAYLDHAGPEAHAYLAPAGGPPPPRGRPRPPRRVRPSLRRSVRSSSGCRRCSGTRHVLPPGSFVFVHLRLPRAPSRGRVGAPAGAPLGRRAGRSSRTRPGSRASPTFTAPSSRSRIRRPVRSRRRGSRAERCGRSRSSTSAGSTARCGRSDTSAATRSSSAARTRSPPLAAWAARRQALRRRAA